ncbi:hypothetical protein V498_06641, partial [Pseudogymnoascus sp. VKM F-4517 (FW-2822)]
NEERLEDEAASNNEIETSRQRSPLQSSSFAEVTHKVSPIFQQMLESQPHNALSDAPRSPIPPIAIQGDLSPQLLNAEYQYIGVSGVEDEAEVPMMSGALKNSQPVYVVGTDSDGDYTMTANTQLALGESLEHNSQLSFTAIELVGYCQTPESLDDSQLILSATEIEMLDRPVTFISDLLPDRERARSPILQGALDFSNNFNQPEALIILGRQPTQQEVLDDSQPIPLIEMLPLPKGQPT